MFRIFTIISPGETWWLGWTESRKLWDEDFWRFQCCPPTPRQSSATQHRWVNPKLLGSAHLVCSWLFSIFCRFHRHLRIRRCYRERLCGRDFSMRECADQKTLRACLQHRYQLLQCYCPTRCGPQWVGFWSKCRSCHTVGQKLNLKEWYYCILLLISNCYKIIQCKIELYVFMLPVSCST